MCPKYTSIESRFGVTRVLNVSGCLCTFIYVDGKMALSYVGGMVEFGSVNCNYVNGMLKLTMLTS